MLNPGEDRGGEDGLLVVLPAEVDVFLVDLDEDSTRGETKGSDDGQPGFQALPGVNTYLEGVWTSAVA